MHDSSTPVTGTADVKHASRHDEIAQCAQDLWVGYGRPGDRDLEIWLEAEQRLLSATQATRGKKSGRTASSGRA